MYNHAALLGEEARINDDLEILGIITNSYHEGSIHWMTIDGSYELAIQSATLIHDLTSGKSFVRLKGF